MPKTANEYLMDATVRHQIKLLRFSKGEAQRAMRLLDASDKEIVAKLEKGMTDFSEARMKAFLKEVRRARAQVAIQLKAGLDEALPGLAASEVDWELTAINAASPVALSLAAVPASTLKAVAGSPINGVPLEGWLGQLVQSDVTRMEQAIRLGVIQGETLRDITGRVMGAADVTRNNAATIARTAVNHVSNSSRQSVWEANADILDGVRWVATLDGRTSDVCASRDGEVYPVDSGPRPPAHPNCRSTITAVLKGEAIVGERPMVRDARTRKEREKDFRAEAKEAAGENWKNMSAAERTAAAADVRKSWIAENVGTVPSNVKYGDWLRDQPEAFQNEVLGKGKADMFRAGMTLDKFVDEKGHSYSLAELQAEYSKDALNVLQPGVGMKAKALLQQGYMSDEVLHALQQEFPDASPTMASIASYKSELKKLGVPLGFQPHATIKQLATAKNIADTVADFETQFPPGLKHALAGQWHSMADELDGAPGAYAHYKSGQGVILSVKKLSGITAEQAKQVMAHEFGHMLHKQHQVDLPEVLQAQIKATAKALSPEAKKLYSYYLTHMDELTAEIYAQALSPSQFTSQGLYAAEFKIAFKDAIQYTKDVLLYEKFPVPSAKAAAAIPNAPTMAFEVAGKHTSIGSLAKALLQQGMPDEQVLLAIKAEFPSAKTGMNSIKSYKSELNKEKKIQLGSGPVVIPTKAALADLKPAVSAETLIVTPVKPSIMNQSPATMFVKGSKIKEAGMEILNLGLMDNHAVTAKLQELFPHNASKINAAMVATWKSVWKKADPDAYFAAANKNFHVTKTAEGTGPAALPFLYNKPMGTKSQGVLANVKMNLQAGATKESQLDFIQKQFEGPPNLQGASNLLELAIYQVETAKAVAKPYMNAAASFKSPLSKKSKVKLVAADTANVIDAFNEAMLDEDFFELSHADIYDLLATKLSGKGFDAPHPFTITAALNKMDDIPSDWANALKSSALNKYKELQVAKAQAEAIANDMTPARLASNPFDGMPPPPRFTDAQHRAALRHYGEPSAPEWAKKVNERFNLKGENAVTAAEIGAIRSYTGNKTYQAMNLSLRKGEYASKPEMQAFVEAAQHGMRKMPPYVGKVTRGVRWLPQGKTMDDMLAMYREGSVVQEDAFTSSSMGDDAVYNGPLYFKINSKTARDVDWISKFSGGEKEVLFMPGTRFKVTKVEKLNGKAIIYMDEV